MRLVHEELVVQIARLWWDRVMKGDEPVDVNEFVDRDHASAARFQRSWE